MFPCVFCIDDDPITLMLCKKVMQKANFAQEIITMENSEKAITFFEENSNNPNNPNVPNLVFLDLNMPIMSGWEFMDMYFKKDFHKIFTKTSIIVLSSTIDPADMEKSKSYPMVIDFLSKPITTAILEKIK